MEKILPIEKIRQGFQRFNRSTWIRLGGVAMLALAAVNQTPNTASAEVPKMRVVEVCASPGHNYVEVDVFNDRDTPLTVTQTTKNKMGVLIPTDPLTIAPHSSDGQNFNVGIIEGGSITYTESGAPNNTFTEDNICGEKSTTTTKGSTTTSTARATTTTVPASSTTTTTRLAPTTSSTVGTSEYTVTTLANSSTIDLPGLVASLESTSTTAVPNTQPAEPQQGRYLALTG